MVDPELVEILKQGSEAWNRWRRHQLDDLQIDLHEADLRDIDLSYANLSAVNLRGADLREANLRNTHLSKADLLGAYLDHTNLDHAHLNEANLSCAGLGHANLVGANLSYANLSIAYLGNAHLGGANLSYTDLSGTDLREVNLVGANLSHANLQNAVVGQTIFAGISLCEIKGLTKLRHWGPSHVELYSVQLPLDGNSLLFLRSAGIADEWIDFWRSTMVRPIQYYSCFISYSSKDDILARRLHTDLQVQGVRCWFALEDMKIGDKIRYRIDEAIHLQDKLLLLLSEHSIASAWVGNEVEAALEREVRQQREVLFPVRLDDAVLQTSQIWAATLCRTRHIGNFTNWTDPQAYQIAFDRLLHDLKKANK